MKIAAGLFVLLAALLPLPSGAAEKKVSAEDEPFYRALYEVYLDHPTLVAEREYVRAVMERKYQSELGQRPTVDLSAAIAGAATRTQDGSDTTLPGEAGILALQNLFDGFRTRAASSAAQNEVFAAENALKQTEQAVLMEAVKAWFDVQAAREYLRAYENNEMVLKNQLEFYEKRRSVGLLTVSDAAKAKSRYARAKSDKITARGELTVAEEAYRKAFNRMAEETFTPADTARLESLIAHDDDYMVAQALRKHPRILAAKYQERAARANVAVAESGDAPRLDLSAGLTYGRPDLGEDEYAAQAKIGLGLTVPLYDSGATVSRTREAKYLYAQKRADIDVLKRDVTYNLLSAQAAYQEAKASLVADREEVQASKISLESMRFEFSNGLRTVTDVLDAEQEHLDAVVSEIRSAYTRNVAFFSLLAASGALTPKALFATHPGWGRSPESSSDSSAH